MTLRGKIMLLAVVPLVLAVSAIMAIVVIQSNRLVEGQVSILEDYAVNAKKAELKNYLSLALTSIDHIYHNADPDDQAAKDEVTKILNELTYGEDGYFFVYDIQGNGIVHPRQPYRVGQNWIDLKDRAGNPVIKELIENARNGGGFLRYVWEKPSSDELADKISYSVMLPKWGWMVGTGLYIDDVVAEAERLHGEVAESIDRTFLSIGFITFVALTFVFVSGLALNISERKLADKKLKQLTQRIVEFQEEERGRVSRELHDGISQILVSVKYALELAADTLDLKPEKASEPLAKGVRNLNQAIQEVRRISRDLRPSVLDDLGLSMALESLTREYQERTGIEVTLKSVAFKNLLTKDVKTTLYRVAQEALTNIERHAQAKHVLVELDSDMDNVRLTISDDGVGFDKMNMHKSKSPLAGIGLRNMAERVDFYGGSLSIKSAPEMGTTIEARLPGELLTDKDSQFRVDMKVTA